MLIGKKSAILKLYQKASFPYDQAPLLCTAQQKKINTSVPHCSANTKLRKGKAKKEPFLEYYAVPGGLLEAVQRIFLKLIR